MKKLFTTIIATSLSFVLLCGFSTPEAVDAAQINTLTAMDDYNLANETALVNSSILYSKMTPENSAVLLNEMDLINELNALRISNGVAPLKVDPTLMDVATTRCAEITVSYSHVRPNNTDCFTVYPLSYGWVGENLAFGYATAKDVLSAWADSSRHLANMTKPQYTSIGVAYCQTEDGRCYWVQCFGG